MKRTILAALVAGTLALSACSSNASSKGGAAGPSSSTATSSSSSSSATGPHNEADVQFATKMVPHHSEALAMADQALSKATDPQVKSLATQIKAAQDPEIKTMSAWLAAWGAPVPSSSMGGMSMDGMMSSAEKARLDTASGAAFDRLWVQLMVKHHTGAIAMARTELNSGQSAQAKKLAQSISTSQAAEIATLTALLPKLPA